MTTNFWFSRTTVLLMLWTVFRGTNWSSFGGMGRRWVRWGSRHWLVNFRLQDLVAAARLAPGKLNFGSGTATYRVALELLHERNQIKATAVPYKGTSAAMTDLAGGNIDYTMAEVSAVLPLVRGGKVRALAVAATERIKELPQVPTVTESGTPGYESYAWTGVFFPAGVPEPVLARMSQAIGELMESDEAKVFIASLGGAVFYGAPQPFGEFQRAEIEKARRIVKTANIGYED